MVRVSRATHARLTQLRDQLMRDYQAGRPYAALPDEYAEGVPLHHVIDRLLNSVQNHRGRARRQRHHRRTRGSGGGADAHRGASRRRDSRLTNTTRGTRGMYTHNLNPAVNVNLAPSRIFGGPERRFIENIVLRANDEHTWRPIDGRVGDPTRGPLCVAPHVARAVYVSRDVRPVRVLTLAWDTPEMIAVYGAAAGWAPGWHECRLLTAAMLLGLQEKAAELIAGAGAAGPREVVNGWGETITVDERGQAAVIEAKVRAVEVAWEEAEAGNAAATASTLLEIAAPAGTVRTAHEKGRER